MVEHRLKDTISRYSCPLIADMYPENEYGDLKDEPHKYDDRN